MTETAERDSVQDQLCARIDELEVEKEILNAQLDRAEERLANLKDQAEALHRVGAALDLDPGTDLTAAASAKVIELVMDNNDLRREVANWRGA